MKADSKNHEMLEPLFINHYFIIYLWNYMIVLGKNL